MRHEKNRIAAPISRCSLLPRMPHVSMPSRVSPMKSAVFPRTRVYLFATRSTLDPLKRDPYGTKKQRLAFPLRPPCDRIDCSRWIFRATRYRRSGGFHTNPTMGTAAVRDTTFLRLGEINWNPEGGCDLVICGAKETPPPPPPLFATPS